MLQDGRDFVAVDDEYLGATTRGVGEVGGDLAFQLGIARRPAVDVDDSRAEAGRLERAVGGPEVFASSDRREGMADERDTPARRRSQAQTDVIERVPRRLEVGVPPAEVGFEVGPLGPLVPGVDEDEPLVAEILFLRLPECRFEPRLVGAGRAAGEDHGVVLAPRRVVPTRHHGAEPRPGRQPLGHVRQRGLLIVEHIAAEAVG